MIFPSEKEPIGESSKKNKINIPNLSIDKYARANSFGRNATKTLLPSNGGIGIRFTIVRIKLYKTII